MSDEIPEEPRGSDDDAGWPPAGDDDLLDPWDEESPELELARARTRMVFRGFVFVAVAAVSAWCAFAFSTVKDFEYFLQSGDDPVDLGDLRAMRMGGRTSLGAGPDPVPIDSYVKLQNQVMTYEAESDNNEYFYDPLFHIITRTGIGRLPKKQEYRTVEIPAKLAWLVEDRHAFAEDLTAGFDGEGRLIRVDQAPRLRYLYDAYKRTIVRLPPPDETWLFLDGDRPVDYWTFAAAYAAAVLLVLMTAWFFIRAVRNYRRLREAL